MKNSLPDLFSYLFMTAAMVALFSAFGTIVIFLRNFFISITDLESKTGFIFLYIFIVSIILTPTFLYFSYKLEKNDKRG